MIDSLLQNKNGRLLLRVSGSLPNTLVVNIIIDQNLQSFCLEASEKHLFSLLKQFPEMCSPQGICCPNDVELFSEPLEEDNSKYQKLPKFLTQHIPIQILFQGDEPRSINSSQGTEIDIFIDRLGFGEAGERYKKNCKRLELYKMNHLSILHDEQFAGKIVDNSAHLFLIKRELGIASTEHGGKRSRNET